VVEGRYGWKRRWPPLATARRYGSPISERPILPSADIPVDAPKPRDLVACFQKAERRFVGLTGRSPSTWAMAAIRLNRTMEGAPPRLAALHARPFYARQDRHFPRLAGHS